MSLGTGTRSNWFARLTTCAVLTLIVGPTQAQEVFSEDFEGATGTGGGPFFDGAGADEVVGWDDGVQGETAFILTVPNAHLIAAAQATTGGGVGDSGAGQLITSDLRFNLLEQDLDAVEGTGGGVFLMGDGSTPDTPGGTNNWDNGISNEGAFFSTTDGAILVGDVSASGNPTGDDSGMGAGVIDVGEINVALGSWFAGLNFDIGSFPPGSGPILLNPNFDGDDNICDGLDSWNLQGDGGYCLNVFFATSGQGGQAEPLSAPQDLKMFNFGGQPTNTEIFQDVDAVPGQLWEVDCFTTHVTGDALAAGNSVEMSIEFYNDSAVLLDSATSTVLDSGSPVAPPSPDTTWIDNTPIQLSAPAGTTTARAIIRFVSDAGAGGAAFVDNVSFAAVGGSFDFGQFSLTADIKGQTSVAGGILGNYQLRLEDEDGDRLVFMSPAVADGNFQSLGGALDMAVELDADGVPAMGAFDPASTLLRVVVAFDNDVAPTWGAGGTLTVDNILLTNTNPTGSNYAGGLFFDDIPVSGSLDPRALTLTADIMGDQVGGQYQLRLEAFDAIDCVNEPFDSATGVGGGQILFPEQTGGGSNDWDTGLENDFAFAGVGNGAIVTTPAGEVSVRGATTGGNPGAAGEIEVHEIAPLAGGWFAGVYWDNQTIGSTDLSAVSLSADVRGTIPGFLEEFGTYVLRIEDGPSGDWVGFETLSNGTWQPVGGPLDTADVSGPGDQGDGVFDVELGRSYRVVLVMEGFDNPEDGTNWNFGGTLQFDNVQLTPCGDPVQLEVARLGFNGLADGGFQTVGGLLSDGFTTLGQSGGIYVPGESVEGQDLDAGIEGEFMFAGLFGGAIGSVTAEGCSDCGSGGSGGARFIAEDLDDTEGGFYFLGAAWPIDALTTPLDLTQISISADLKGEWNAGAGGSPGTIVFRLEEPGNAANAAFSMQADGSFNNVGGLLDCSDAQAGQTCDQGLIDLESPSYTLVVLIFTQDPSWGTNASVTMDNLTITQGGMTVLSEDFETVIGPQPGFIPESADFYTVAVTLEEGIETWGTAGATLTIDNINLSEQLVPPCTEFGECGDLDDNNIRDEACLFYTCEDNLCGSLARATQGDLGGGNGACPIDGACDGNDRFHALNCFSNVNTTGDGTYPCEGAPPSSINVDAGSQGISCTLDGVCDGNDAFHALNCFSNVDSLGAPPYPCACSGPLPQAPASGGTRRTTSTGLTLRAPQSARPGEVVNIDVHLDDQLKALRGYQLHLGVAGGRRGDLELLDLSVDRNRPDYAFTAVPQAWQAFNVSTQQLLVGVDDVFGEPVAADAYLGTFSYRIPKDAAGTFVIDVRVDALGDTPRDRTFVFGAYAAPIEVSAVTPARVTVAQRERALRAR